MQEKFRGRSTELKILDKKYQKDGFVMAVLYGRRRVGKTKLINAPFDKAEFDKLMDKIKYIPSTDLQICVFSLCGFTDYAKKKAGKCRLISIEDMYRRQ